MLLQILKSSDHLAWLRLKAVSVWKISNPATTDGLDGASVTHIEDYRPRSGSSSSHNNESCERENFVSISDPALTLSKVQALLWIHCPAFLRLYKQNWICHAHKVEDFSRNWGSRVLELHPIKSKAGQKGINDVIQYMGNTVVYICFLI